ncbi:MAG: amidohydrolase family protein, partial [Pseudomonadota bacterium]|nr:amidohydrolase family protein [Pseudomonadota bacterium]
MSSEAKPRVIAIEEHYWDAELSARMGRAAPADLQKRISDLGALRLKEMDEAGIDMQVLSHGAPATQNLDAESAVPLARAANDRLHEFIQANPRRFAAFAVLPTADPKAAADEFARAVTKLGFKGAMVHGLTNGHFLDEK